MVTTYVHKQTIHPQNSVGTPGISGGVNVHTWGVYQCCKPPHIGWWFVCVHGREGWAPFSYLEPVHLDSGKGETNSEGSEEEDTLQIYNINISEYGEY